MALKRQFSDLSVFSMSSMTDVIFLLLIFFMVTSTIIFPSGVDVILPQSSEQTQLKPVTEVYIDSLTNLYLVIDRNDSIPENKLANPVTPEQLAAELERIQAIDSVRAVALFADEKVEYGNVVNVLDIAAKARLKMVLATRARESAPASGENARLVNTPQVDNPSVGTTFTEE